MNGCKRTERLNMGHFLGNHHEVMTCLTSCAATMRAKHEAREPEFEKDSSGLNTNCEEIHCCLGLRG